MGPEGQAGLVSSGGTWESPLSGDDSCPRENVSCWGPGMRLCFAGPVRGLEGEGRPSLLSVLSRMLPWIAWEGWSGQVQGQRADIPSWLPPHWVIVSGRRGGGWGGTWGWPCPGPDGALSSWPGPWECHLRDTWECGWCFYCPGNEVESRPAV